MRYLSGDEEKNALECMVEASGVALKSTCRRSRCGSIICKDDELIGVGFNSPPNNDEGQRRCSCSQEGYNKKVTDKTCCIHAEQRAIMDALRKNPGKLKGSRLYFVRIDENGKPTRAGKPYCTICSKMALDVGIAEFFLWDEKGICVYDTGEYNLLSFEYSE